MSDRSGTLDPYAKNSLQQPDRVALRDAAAAEVGGGVLTLTLPSTSWTAVSLGS